MFLLVIQYPKIARFLALWLMLGFAWPLPAYALRTEGMEERQHDKANLISRLQETPATAQRSIGLGFEEPPSGKAIEVAANLLMEHFGVSGTTGAPGIIRAYLQSGGNQRALEAAAGQFHSKVKLSNNEEDAKKWLVAIFIVAQELDRSGVLSSDGSPGVPSSELEHRQKVVYRTTREQLMQFLNGTTSALELEAAAVNGILPEQGWWVNRDEPGSLWMTADRFLGDDGEAWLRYAQSQLDFAAFRYPWNARVNTPVVPSRGEVDFFLRQIEILRGRLASRSAEEAFAGIEAVQQVLARQGNLTKWQEKIRTDFRRTLSNMIERLEQADGKLPVELAPGERGWAPYARPELRYVRHIIERFTDRLEKAGVYNEFDMAHRTVVEAVDTEDPGQVGDAMVQQSEALLALSLDPPVARIRQRILIRFAYIKEQLPGLEEPDWLEFANEQLGHIFDLIEGGDDNSGKLIRAGVYKHVNAARKTVRKAVNSKPPDVDQVRRRVLEQVATLNALTIKDQQVRIIRQSVNGSFRDILVKLPDSIERRVDMQIEIATKAIKTYKDGPVRVEVLSVEKTHPFLRPVEDFPDGKEMFLVNEIIFYGMSDAVTEDLENLVLAWTNLDVTSHRYYGAPVKVVDWEKYGEGSANLPNQFAIAVSDGPIDSDRLTAQIPQVNLKALSGDIKVEAIVQAALIARGIDRVEEVGVIQSIADRVAVYAATRGLEEYN